MAATIAHVEQAPPTVWRLVPSAMWRLCPQVKESGSAAGIIGGLLIFLAIIGGLLIFLGIIGLIGTLVGGAASFVGGLVLIGLGILVASVGPASGL
jgi:hypothetical protein